MELSLIGGNGNRIEDSIPIEEVVVDKRGVHWNGKTVCFGWCLDVPCLKPDDYYYAIPEDHARVTRNGDDPAKKRVAIEAALAFQFLVKLCPDHIPTIDWMKEGYWCRRVGVALAKYGNQGIRVLVHYLYVSGIESVGGVSDTQGYYWTWRVPFEEMKRIIELGQSFDFSLKESGDKRLNVLRRY